MRISFDDLFRVLTSFSPQSVDLRGAPWEDFVDWAIAQGLGPWCGYNLEYRLPQARAPEWVRHRLLSVYQGSLNDNVMKLVNLKHAIGELSGQRVVVAGAASFAESLYPHVAFRPVMEIHLLVAPSDVQPLQSWLKRSEFIATEAPARAGSVVLSDTRTHLEIHGAFFDDASQSRSALSRAVRWPAFGPSAYRLCAEDALLVQVLMMARASFEVPILDWVDIRELILGAPAMGGAYSSPLDSSVVLARAAETGASRALWVALEMVGRWWPEMRNETMPFMPDLSTAVAQVLRASVVEPLSVLGRTSELRGLKELRSLLF